MNTGGGTAMQEKQTPKVLLHICCGPCATYPVPWLREHGYNVMGYFYNPNIHPFTEYQCFLRSFLSASIMFLYSSLP